MINVSNEFRKLMNTRTDFKENAEITFADGTVLNLTEKDFTVSNNGMTDAAETNGIPLGIALCRSIQIELMNDNDKFSEYDFFGAVIRLYLTFQLSATTERIEYGTFTVLTPETYGETVIITALDDMHKSDKDYATSLVFPTTTQAILVDACNVLGISLGTTSFMNDDFVVEAAPTGITYRQLFGYIAMIAGGNARIDTTGRLRIISYDFEKLSEVSSVIDGGKYVPWNNPTDLDGGTFSPWSEGDVVDGGSFTDRYSFHMLSNWSNLKVDTDDVVITGISTTYTDEENEEHTVMYGVEGYLLQIENPLIDGKEQAAVDLIGAVMVGGKFRQFSGDLVADPTLEFMDHALIIDRKGNMYVSFLTDINFQFFGFTTIKNSAEPTLRNSSKGYSDATKTLVAARKMIQNERTARETAVAQLAKDLANSSGLFMTQEQQEDGSVIYYMHNKPTLTESMIVWKLTALAFGISTDGGKTYPYGFTVDGTTITRLLYAEGIDADYINTGAIRIADTSGKELFYADYDTKAVRINADNVFIGSQSVSSANTELSSSIKTNADAITAEVKRAQGQEVELAAAISLTAEQISLKVSKGDVSSQLSVESGAVSIKSNRFSWDSTYSSLTADGKLTVKSGEIGAFTLTNTGLVYGNQTITGGNGVYIGNAGISVGNAFRVSIDGDLYLGYKADIETYGTINFKESLYSYIKYNNNNAIHFRSGAVDIYGDTVLPGGNLEVKGGDIVVGAYPAYIRGSVLTHHKIMFETSKTSIVDMYSIIGKYDGFVGFFGNDGATQKTVSVITSTETATVNNVAIKVNELINALKAYNLIR